MGQPWYTSGDASGGFDTTDLEKLIASLSRAQAPTDEDRSAARSQALQVAGLSLLGTPKGQVWGRAGQAGMNALMAKQQYLSDIPKQRAAALQSAGQAMTLQEQLEALKERKQYEAGLRGGLLQAPGAEPTAGPTSIAPSMAQAFAAPPLPPSVSGVLNNPGGALPGLPPVSQLSQAPAVPPSSIEPSAPAPGATGTDPYSVLMKQAMQAQNVYQTTGNRYAQKQAEHFFGLAEKWREKLGEPKVGMVGGKPTLVRYGDYGGQQNVAGVEPTPDFATVDRGGSTDFVNRYTIPSTGQSFTKSMTPGEVAADARAKAQLAQSERHFQAGQNAPTWDSTSGQFVYKPNKNAPTGSAVSPTGYEKPDKPLTESQAKATAFANMQAASTDIINRLSAKDQPFTGKGKGQQYELSKAGTEGIPYVPGSAAIPRSLASDDAQKYDQASMQWSEAQLRFLTGANAPEAEVRRNRNLYFPVQGDSDAKIEQKTAMRQFAEQSIRYAAGQGNKNLPDMPPPQLPPDSTQPKVVKDARAIIERDKRR